MQIDERALEAAAEAQLNTHRAERGLAPCKLSDMKPEHRPEWIREAEAAIRAYLSALTLGTRLTLADGTEAVVVSVPVLKRLTSAAKICYGQAEGCAANHYGDDYHIHGAPGSLDREERGIRGARGDAAVAQLRSEIERLRLARGE